LAAGIAGARFLEVPGCGHCPPLEQPEQFIAAIKGFVEAINKRPKNYESKPEEENIIMSAENRCSSLSGPVGWDNH
jgi:hypothetical protein